MLVSPSSGRVVHEVRTLGVGPRILLQPLVLGVCGTDLDIIRGSRDDHPAVLGHEGVARVVETDGEHDPGLTPGRHIVFNPVNPVDPSQVLGHSRPGVFGTSLAFSPMADAWRPWSLLDPAITPELGCLAEPIGVTLYGLGIAMTVRPPERLLVVGAGIIGQIYALTARLLGCQHVVLVDTSADRLHWAELAGVIPPGSTIHLESNLMESNPTRAHEDLADLGVLCVPRRSATSAANWLLPRIRHGGLVDLLSGFGEEDTLCATPMIRPATIRRGNNCGAPAIPSVKPHMLTSGRQVWIYGHRGTSTDHMQQAMAFLVEYPQEYARLIEHRVPWPDAAEWLAEMATDRSVTQPPTNGKTLILLPS